MYWGCDAWCFVRFGDSVFGASARREKEEDRVAELLLALGDSQTVSLRDPCGYHVEVELVAPLPVWTGPLVLETIISIDSVA